MDIKKLFGPLIRKDIRDKWHWYKHCPELDKDSEEIRISSFKPEKKELCKVCYTRFEKITGNIRAAAS